MTQVDTETKDKNMNIPDGYELITEGTVSMIFPKSENSVFYNPVQVQNRDLSILMISLYSERRAKRAYINSVKKRDKITLAEAEAAASKIDWSKYVETNSRKDGLRILDALAASGLRSIRYYKEIPAVKEVIINDLEEAAVNLAKENMKFNKIPEDAPITVNLGDATSLMYNSREHTKQFDVIDLDPYGSAAPFLDGAVQAIKDGGMLAITCTDMAALGGSHPETCFGRYGSMPIQRARYLQEFALRILLQSISRTANVYGRTIKPILCVGMAFYVRVFVEVYDDKAGVSQSSTNIGNVYQSTQCDSFYIISHGNFNGRNYQPGRTSNQNPLKDENSKPSKKEKNKKSFVNNNEKQNKLISHSLPSPFQCPETSAPFKIGGPIWLGRLHEFDVVNNAIEFLENMEKNNVNIDATCPSPIFQTKKRLHGLLTSVSEELPDSPLYYTLPSLCHTMHCSAPPLLTFYSAIRNAGFQVSAYHKEPNAIKTNAPPDVVWDIMRAWCDDNPIAKKWITGVNENSATAKIMSRGLVRLIGNNDSNKVDFTVKKTEPRKKAQRFPMNPTANWGPKPRAGSKRSISSDKSSGENINEQKENKREKRMDTTDPPE